MCRRMAGGLCYLETFKAELSLVILCSVCQKGRLTLKLVLLNSCPHPQVMCVPINKWCCWCCGHSALTFIHISPLWPCKSNQPQDVNIFISLVLLPWSYKTERSWLFCSSDVSLHVPWCSGISGPKQTASVMLQIDKWLRLTSLPLDLCPVCEITLR